MWKRKVRLAAILVALLALGTTSPVLSDCPVTEYETCPARIPSQYAIAFIMNGLDGELLPYGTKLRAYPIDRDVLTICLDALPVVNSRADFYTFANAENPYEDGMRDGEEFQFYIDGTRVWVDYSIPDHSQFNPDEPWYFPFVKGDTTQYMIYFSSTPPPGYPVTETPTPTLTPEGATTATATVTTTPTPETLQAGWLAKGSQFTIRSRDIHTEEEFSGITTYLQKATLIQYVGWSGPITGTTPTSWLIQEDWCPASLCPFWYWVDVPENLYFRGFELDIEQAPGEIAMVGYFEQSSTATATPAATATETVTETPTNTSTSSPTATSTDTATVTSTPTLTQTPTSTSTLTLTPTETATSTATPSSTPTVPSYGIYLPLIMLAG